MSARNISSLLFASMAFGLTVFLLACAGLRLSWSGSVPRGLYLTVDRPVERGAIVVACLPEHVGRWAVGRGYLSRGSCPGDASPVGKPVSGLAGDLVWIEAGGISINRDKLRHSERTLADSAGRPMPWASFCERRLLAGELWLYSEHHPRSFDSRIFGPLRSEAVREVLVPLWVEDSR